MTINIDIVKSKNISKKYDAIIHREDGRTKKVSFGARGYSHYTDGHLDPARKQRYIDRHSRMNEDWSADGYDTAGFWSRWLTWEWKTLKQAVSKMNEKFPNLNIKLKV